ncbi:hypothetical protein QBZ16_002825 [Prototheca wickerhamii]|uniref:Purple acid phosphatase n=1 Tax=Prototheca wickerhamii TaxID=3111 RepID=A0AAD9IL29_PROWI|nr:hypothetical protein QBZ16_002825 [Prototheca wickerhamii]
MAHAFAFLTCLLVLAPGLSARLLIQSLNADGTPVSTTPHTVGYNFSDATPDLQLRGSPDLPMTDPRLVQTPHGHPGQVSLMYYGPSEVRNYSVSKSLSDLAPPQSVASVAQIGTESGVYSKNVTGDKSTTYNQIYDYPDSFQYRSPRIHSVIFTELEPNTTYFYRVRGGNNVTWSPEYNFTTLPTGEAVFPLRVGLIGDGGQTYNSSATYEHLLADNPQVILHVGDLSYADDYLTNGTVWPPVYNGTTTHPAATFQPRWDSWQQLVQPLLSKIPFVPTAGNHEIEPQVNGQEFVSYSNRFPTPFNKSGSHSQLWYSLDVGPVHVIAMTPYAPFDHTSEQYAWLKHDLRSVDRKKTPWVVAISHAPWYSSYVAHYLEANCQRKAVEPLLYNAATPVYDFTVDECGPVHLVLGDGGNIEQLAADFADMPGHCPKPSLVGPPYQPVACPEFLYGDGAYCESTQPYWSAFREPSFGHSTIEFINATHALFEWKRNQDAQSVVADSTMLVRGNKAAECAWKRNQVKLPH